MDDSDPRVDAVLEILDAIKKAHSAGFSYDDILNITQVWINDVKACKLSIDARQR